VDYALLGDAPASEGPEKPKSGKKDKKGDKKGDEDEKDGGKDEEDKKDGGGDDDGDGDDEDDSVYYKGPLILVAIISCVSLCLFFLYIYKYRSSGRSPFASSS
jgi:hypothetical protein